MYPPARVEPLPTCLLIPIFAASISGWAILIPFLQALDIFPFDEPVDPPKRSIASTTRPTITKASARSPGPMRPRNSNVREQSARQSPCLVWLQVALMIWQRFV